MLNLNSKEISDLRNKISNSEDFNFTIKEKELMFKMVGFDLFSVSELRTIGILFLDKELKKPLK